MQMYKDEKLQRQVKRCYLDDNSSKSVTNDNNFSIIKTDLLMNAGIKVLLINNRKHQFYNHSWDLKCLLVKNVLKTQPNLRKSLRERPTFKKILECKSFCCMQQPHCINFFAATHLYALYANSSVPITEINDNMIQPHLNELPTLNYNAP